MYSYLLFEWTLWHWHSAFTYNKSIQKIPCWWKKTGIVNCRVKVCWRRFYLHSYFGLYVYLLLWLPLHLEMVSLTCLAVMFACFNIIWLVYNLFSCELPKGSHFLESQYSHCSLLSLLVPSSWSPHFLIMARSLVGGIMISNLFYRCNIVETFFYFSERDSRSEKIWLWMLFYVQGARI